MFARAWKSVSIIMIAISALSVLQFAEAQCYLGVMSGCNTGGGSLPTYFSGTNCRFYVYATPWANYGDISHFKISINGELVYETFPWPNDFMGIIDRITFDSTRWADGSTITITLLVEQTSGSISIATASATAYNKATLYGRHDFETTPGGAGTPHAKTFLQAMNHDVSRTVTALGWTKAQILNDLNPATVFYVNTHGLTGPPKFQSDRDEAPGGIGEDIYPSAAFAGASLTEVSEVRHAAVGTGTPPFQTGTPPINLTWIDACWTATTNDFATSLLWPWVNSYNSNYTENQSELGWNFATAVTATTPDNIVFWADLNSGKTAVEARADTVTAYFNSGATDPGNAYSPYLICWGDYYTRLHKYVYNRSTAIPSDGWWRHGF